MKNFLVTCFFSSLFIISNAQLKYSISGEFINLPFPSSPIVKDGDTIYLEASNINKRDIAIIKNNKFQFSGSISEPTVAFVKHDHGGVKILLDNSSYLMSFKQFILRKENKTTYFDVEQSLKTNSKFHNLWADYLVKLDSIYSLKTKLLSKIDHSKDTDSINIYKRKIQIIDNSINFDIKKLALENPNNYAVPYILSGALDFSYKNYIGIYNALSLQVKNSVLGKQFLKKLNAVKNLDDGVSDNNESTSKDPKIVGLTMPVIKAINISNEKVVLNNNFYKKYKFTLIELWASWCVPCRQVNTDLHVKRDQFKKMGLNIVGFSLDENYGNWVNAVKNDNTGWLQISDLKVSNSPLSIFLKLESIPANLLINSNGKVVAQNLYQDELKNFLLKNQDDKKL